MSPVVFFMGIAAIIYTIRAFLKTKRVGFDGLIVAVIVLFAAFYAFYHYHTYYMLPIMPFILLLVARMLSEQVKDVSWLSIGAVLMVAQLLFFTFAMLGAHKYGFNEYEQISGIVNNLESENVVLEVPGLIAGNDLPALKYLMPNIDIRSDANPKDFPKNRKILWWIKAKGYDETYVNKSGVWLCNTYRFSPAVFGYRLSVNPLLQTHRFDMGEIGIEEAPDCLFGMSAQSFPAYILIDWSQNGTPLSG